MKDSRLKAQDKIFIIRNISSAFWKSLKSTGNGTRAAKSMKVICAFWNEETGQEKQPSNYKNF